jgi:hypothetical protein
MSEWMNPMVDHFDERLKNWILSVAEGAEVSLAAPNGPRPGSGIGLYLIEVMKAPPPHTIKRPAPLQLTLRYLITAWSEKPEDAHQQLVGLMLAAMESGEYEVESEPLPINVWTAFGAPPRPSFLLRVPLSHERPPLTAKLVRQPLKIESSPTTTFYGLLVGPGETPLSDCRVEIPALGLSATTDYKGMFFFPCVPGEGVKNLIVMGRGQELSVSTDGNYPDSQAPMVIKFSSLED